MEEDKVIYDVNPDMYGEFLSLNVDDVSSQIDFSLAINSAKYYGVDSVVAKEEMEMIRTILNENWRLLAKKYEINRNEIEKMKPAFEKM